ncbi:hypothetical protein [Paraburkholderia sediminicola]|uniref:hypothetical protein n=1 Tax=Paraburkholderia sediminicola TaxID=458836 RepID=UPI0038BCD571
MNSYRHENPQKHTLPLPRTRGHAADLTLSSRALQLGTACPQLTEKDDTMSVNLQPVTGQEVLWGDMKPTPNQLKLINASPTFVSDIHEADERIKSGAYRPIAVISDSYTQFDPVRKQVILTPQLLNDDDTELLGTLSHELSHFLDDPKERAFAQNYGVNPRDPDAYNQAATRYIRAQAVAEGNQWKIAREVEQNTATPDQPGTKLTGAGSSALFPYFDEAYAKNTNAGLTETQIQNRLISSFMGSFASTQSDVGAGSEYNADGSMSGSAPIEPGQPTVHYNSDDRGDITSMTETWPSGDVSTQTFKDGKRLQSQTVDSQGKPLRTANYSYYRPDGSYGVNVTDGGGKTIQQSDFNADGSGTERGYRPGGSRMETQFGPTMKGEETFFSAENRTKLMTQYDSQGRETQKDYFDPNEGVDTNQVVTRPNGSKTLYSFNDQGKIGLQSDYDAKGNPVDKYRYDPGSGRVSSHTHYNQDGSRTLDSVRTDGNGTRVTIKKDGNRSVEQPMTFSATDQQAFKEHSERAAKIAPPQPVGAETALGGQNNYYDPGNNRLTNQDITHPDGSKTSYAYNDQNLVGYEQNFDKNGRIVSARHYVPAGGPDVIVQYAPDGSRQVMRPNNGQPVVEHYNADNQLTRKQMMGGGETETDDYDPLSGRVGDTTVRKPDGGHSVYSYNDLGNVGEKFDYDSKGQPTASIAFDRNEGTGTLTMVDYNGDGSRNVTKVDRSGARAYTVGSDGQISATQSRPLTSADHAALNRWMWSAGMTTG